MAASHEDQDSQISGGPVEIANSKLLNEGRKRRPLEHSKIEQTKSYPADSNKAVVQLNNIFMVLCSQVSEHIAEKDGDSSKVSSYLKYLPPDLQAIFQESVSLSSNVSQYWDLLNPELLYHIIAQLNSECISIAAQSYKEQLEHFYNNCLVRDMPAFEGEDYPNGQNIMFKLPNEKYMDLSLTVFIGFIEGFNTATKSKGPARLKKVKIGSFYLTVAIPIPLDKEVFSNCQEVRDFLVKQDVLAVIINKECVYVDRSACTEIEPSLQKQLSQNPKAAACIPKGDLEMQCLKIFQEQSKRLSIKEEISENGVFPHSGSMLCYQKEFMLIASDGDIEPSGVKVAKRQANDTLMSQAKNKHANHLKMTPNFEEVSESTAIDLKIAIHKICRSKLINLTSVKLDIKGLEKPKECYLEAIETFLRNCRDTGAYIWYIGHSEKDTGNWCFQNGTISFKEVLEVYRKVQKEKEKANVDNSAKLLAIISDCSYSGNWVRSCAQVLDDEKIPPCGHKTSDKSLLVRIYCSASEDQEAQELCYSCEGVKVRDDGDISFLDTSVTSQRVMCHGDFTKFICCRDPIASQLCRMGKDIKDWTWIDIVTGKLRRSIYIIQGHVSGEKHWFIILLFNKGEEFIERYEAQVVSGSIDTSNWGYLLDSAAGEVPPREIIDKVTEWTFV